ncbi:MAG TPA: hypothetical protein PKY35_06755 [Candidatus Hydrogenedentes bacterium]|nr:hypothetical protein [Candidatus Hydrogenedentota bacterium]HOL76713.1 hypothetical protein [Candidatus Hydrogenedentota bacterium]HPO85326.1 hypothetical protein [Candidatus Hydrogenedentota bacterium]
MSEPVVTNRFISMIYSEDFATRVVPLQLICGKTRTNRGRTSLRFAEDLNKLCWFLGTHLTYLFRELDARNVFFRLPSNVTASS